MKILQDRDGHAISYERETGIVRLLHASPRDADVHPPYFGALHVRPFCRGVVMLSAMTGTAVLRAQLRLVVRLLLEEGYTTLYADRAARHQIPHAKQIEEGDFAGLWRVDLTTLPMRRHYDHQPVAERP